jgi:diguanylate cyclase (GGDEF)-like protein
VLILATIIPAVLASVCSYGLAALLRSVTLMRDQMDQLARSDDLTGLYNRRAFLLEARRSIALAVRQRAPLSLLMIDLDGFKRVNDTCGHSSGDAALVGVAEVLASNVRAGDLVGRIGGDEFAVLLYAANPAAASVAAERLRAAIADLRIAVSDHEIRVTASIGHAAVVAQEDLLAAVHRADTALYRAKANGRDRTELAGAV